MKRHCQGQGTAHHSATNMQQKPNVSNSAVHPGNQRERQLVKLPKAQLPHQSLRKPQAKIISIVGCGGDRDRTKRPKMAKIAVAKSDHVILTSDNPRTEDPLSILDEMRAGLNDIEGVLALTIPDRKQAIQTAIVIANPNDIILIAGKGHEKYQEINGVKYDFDDFNTANELFNQMKK